MAKTDRLSQYLDNDVILWKDKKRYLGLPISFTTYSFDNNRLYIRSGLFKTVEDEILLYRILDVTIKRTLFQKIFGVGSIFLNTADQTSPVVEIKNIKNSNRVRKALSTIIEKERDEKRVLGKEMFGSAGFEHEDFTAHSLNLD